MAPAKYQQRIPTIHAERLDTSKPANTWPAGVHDDGAGGLVVEMPAPMPPAPVQNGDWILSDAAGTTIGALADADFVKQYEIAIGPSGQPA